MNYEINCVIFDKSNPLDNTAEPTEISLITIVSGESFEDVIFKLKEYYFVKEIISVVEI